MVNKAGSRSLHLRTTNHSCFSCPIGLKMLRITPSWVKMCEFSQRQPKISWNYFTKTETLRIGTYLSKMLERVCKRWLTYMPLNSIRFAYLILWWWALWNIPNCRVWCQIRLRSRHTSCHKAFVDPRSPRSRNGSSPMRALRISKTLRSLR